jgi:hypothetical protein
MATIKQYEREANKLIERANELMLESEELRRDGLEHESDELALQALRLLSTARQYMVIVNAMSQPTILN